MEVLSPYINNISSYYFVSKLHIDYQV